MSGLQLTGAGYEGRTLDAFVADLSAHGVTHVVDVRLNAISRKAGFSKRALQAGLAAAGIAYSHFPELGNERENRAGYAETAGASAETARETFRSKLQGDGARERLEQVLELARTESVAVFCYEADQRHCHRAQVIEEAWKLQIRGLVAAAR